MLNAASRESALPEFYHALMESELFAVGEMGERMSLDTVTSGSGGRFHPVFTSAQRLRHFLREPRPAFRILGRLLFESARGAPFVLNPGAELCKTLVPEEIAYWLNQTRGPPTNLVEVRPTAYPTRLIKALCVLFTSRSAIRSAHLIFVAREGIDKEGHPVIGLEADDEVARLAREIFAVAAEAMPGTQVDVVGLDPAGPLTPLQQHLLGVAPFYLRTATLN